MPTRRTFIRQSGIVSGLLLLGSLPLGSLGKDGTIKITILYTNDTQGMMEPFPEQAPQFAGLGGIQARADLVQQIRAEEQNVLLFDTGDFFQGSPGFDLHKGAPQIKAMQLMGYQAAGIGEHEFDGGIQNLALQISRAGFPFLCCNYDFQHSALAGSIRPFCVIEQAGLKIGVLGLSPNFADKIPEEALKNIVYQDPLAKANETAAYLKKKQHCDFIICLSHLGLDEQTTVNDKTLAKGSRFIDLIIGGHSHALLQKPLRYLNLDKMEISLVQAGWGGAHLGRIDYLFSTRKNILSANAQTVEIGK